MKIEEKTIQNLSLLNNVYDSKFNLIKLESKFMLSNEFFGETNQLKSKIIQTANFAENRLKRPIDTAKKLSLDLNQKIYNIHYSIENYKSSIKKAILKGFYLMNFKLNLILFLKN